jgi:hypothetical protein
MTDMKEEQEHHVTISHVHQASSNLQKGIIGPEG